MAKLRWHAAFFDVIRLEFEDFNSYLEYFYEYSVGIDPKRIDVVVIKKKDNVEVDKNIGVILRKYNIIEYKNYDILLPLDEYYKAHGRLRFYAAEEKISNVDISLVFFLYSRPDKLFSELELEDKKICKTNYNGIYEVLGEGYKTYVVVINELSEEDNYWLVNFHKSLTATEIKQLICKIEKKEMLSVYNSFVELIIEKNIKSFKELIMQNPLRALTRQRSFIKLMESHGFIQKKEMEITMKKEKESILKEKERVLKENERVLKEKEQVLKENERVLKEEREQILKEKERIARENEQRLKKIKTDSENIIIRNLMQSGMDCEGIAKVMNLPISRIKRLK
ncbi:MAG: hypothetical protein LBB88_01200 [Planctomycetaceae bacterium]|jgi:hypothetical protein|nr:hypothetical protein [Planctomycetaceae bacterium]